ncbi:hypothetical protein [Parasitella parasitica]|uniref:Uncharacterized protein n=1 Tax=Parasitella parasitica TaxID=35722 RepID=A0A0B7N6J2_9FUNG|nr:hypothetical protein [Parasitella parasitica]
MGLLKFGSLYKKKSKKTETVPTPPVPVVAPIILKLDLDLNNSSSLHDTNTIAATTLSQQQGNNSINNAYVESGSLFDDIFSELTTIHGNPVIQQESMKNDISLAIALSQRLQLEENVTRNAVASATKKKDDPKPNSNKDKESTFFLGEESIYGNYFRDTATLDGNNGQPSSTFSTSMFDNLLSNSNNSEVPPTSAAKNNSTTHNVTTKVVLDSDISGSDEDDSQNESQDDDCQRQSVQGNQRMTKGVRPILERRTQDKRLLVQRKIDDWANPLVPETNRIELNESVIDRMKDRHRNQVKLAALRQQQDKHHQYDMMSRHMVTQHYGPAAIPLPPNVVLPHSGMLMDPTKMHFPTPLNKHILEMPGSNTAAAPPVPVPLPAGFLPNPAHATLAIPQNKGREETDQHTTALQRQTLTKPFLAQSYSTPTTPNHPKPNLSPPAMPSSVASVLTSITSSTTGNINTQTLEPSPASSSVALQSAPPFLPMDVDDDNIDDESVIAESPIQESFQLNMEEETVGAEADAESSDDEERKSVILRKKKSSKKLRQKQQQNDTDLPSSSDTNSTRSRQIRSSRSAPNFKKKHLSKKVSKSTSRSSSRRNSQETCTSPSELNTTPPPPPLPTERKEELHYHLPRSHSHQQQQHHQQDGYYHSHSLRHMKSVPDFLKRSQHTSAQQQQLSNEWERMQTYQKEQQLKKQYDHGYSLPFYLSSNQQQRQPMSYIPVYSSPVYYSTVLSPMIPYMAGNSMDAYSPRQDNTLRASVMSGYNNTMVYQSPTAQGYYQCPSNR